MSKMALISKKDRKRLMALAVKAHKDDGPFAMQDFLDAVSPAMVIRLLEALNRAEGNFP